MLRCGETDLRRLQEVSIIGTILELLLLRMALMMRMMRRLMWVVQMVLVVQVVRVVRFEILASHTRATVSRIGSRDWAVAYNIVPQQRACKRTGCTARRYSDTVAVGMWNLISPMASGSDSSLTL